MDFVDNTYIPNPVILDLGAWFKNEKYTPMAQIIVSFAYGVVLSPWGSGLFFLVVSLIFYELFYAVCTGCDPRYYNPYTRTGVIYASILGWIVGRTLSGDPVLKEGVPLN